MPTISASFGSAFDFLATEGERKQARAKKQGFRAPLEGRSPCSAPGSFATGRLFIYLSTFAHLDESRSSVTQLNELLFPLRVDQYDVRCGVVAKVLATVASPGSASFGTRDMARRISLSSRGALAESSGPGGLPADSRSP
jgi:hypothetical protein